MNKPFREYVVLKDFYVEGGHAARWFLQPGGGMQYIVSRSVGANVRRGWLAEAATVRPGPTKSADMFSKSRDVFMSLL